MPVMLLPLPQVLPGNAIGGLAPADKLARIRALQDQQAAEAGGNGRCLVAMVSKM
jgi:hypothetical protein